MSFSAFLRRNFWLVPLTLTAILALTVSSGVAHFSGLFFAPDERLITTPPLMAKGVPTTMATSPRVVTADAILSRNPFDSVTGPISKVALVPEDEEPEAEIKDPRDAPPCDGVKVLIIAASTDPEWSFAAFGGPGEGKGILKRRGQDVNGKKIEFVGWDRVWLSNGGRSLCQAEMFRGEAAPPAKVETPVDTPPPTPRKGAPPLDPSIAKGIQKISATEFNIDRSVVDRILENQADLMRQARIVPEQENGKVVGIRMFGVRSDTLLGVLGMENGDRLQTINGFDMASPEKALEAYARLRQADHLTIQMNRRGQNMNIDYNIK